MINSWKHNAFQLALQWTWASDMNHREIEKSGLSYFMAMQFVVKYKIFFWV